MCTWGIHLSMKILKTGKIGCICLFGQRRKGSSNGILKELGNLQVVRKTENASGKFLFQWDTRGDLANQAPA